MLRKVLGVVALVILAFLVFELSPEGAGTRVSWSMAGEVGFTEKLFSVFVDMDAMIGKDFEAGLAALKGVAEKGANRL